MKSQRFSTSKDNSSSDDNFSLAVSQFLYKIDTLQNKFDRCLENIERTFRSIQDDTGIQNIDELKIENHMLLAKVKEYEAKNENYSHQNHTPTYYPSCKYILFSNIFLTLANDRRRVDREIVSLKDIHASEIKHLQTSHEKLVYEIKEMHAQKEQRLQERIEMLSKTFEKDQELNIVRDLQEALDKIRAITKPVYNQKIRDCPDFRILKNERLEVTYVDFVTYLAKQAIRYMDKLEALSDNEDGENTDLNRHISPSKSSSKNVSY